ncbi:MAG: flagellar basal-body rod protein FlgB [Motiliproteus sp.]|jgi:flagellar basal-body rod protein FlgB
MAISFESALGIHPQALLLRTERAEILAGNIVNADTPNYKARDIDFQAILNGALKQQGAPLGMSATQSGHQGGVLNPDFAAEMLYRTPLQPSLDGNTVDVQQEQAEYAKNALAFQASYTFLNKKMTGLMSAIKGD